MTKETASQASYLLSRIDQLQNEITRFEENKSSVSGRPISVMYLMGENDEEEINKTVVKLLKQKLLNTEKELKKLK